MTETEYPVEDLQKIIADGLAQLVIRDDENVSGLKVLIAVVAALHDLLVKLEEGEK